ncbi:MAG: type 2 isopentenyl-diphosphate Delta-isomerase [Chloroflexi bacterium]|nr:type 2 isopentenyl-diphosphate Delta-isomerase [Chloroflexota bacterium]
MEAIERRKADHLRLAASDRHQSPGAGWEDIHLVHDALPVTDAEDIDLGAELLGHRLRLPLVIAGMTGGHPMARDLNADLARAAERHAIAMGLGSQRAALRDPSVANTYSVARDVAPDAVLLANVGVSQLIDQRGERALGASELRDAVAMIRANALVIHLNYLEESVQPEGQRRARGALEAIAAAVRTVDVPVVLKETGGGISREVAIRARDEGVAALDVGGYGGTSFASIEAERAAAAGDMERARLGETFAHWGIPTPASVAACADVLPVIATGGLRSGLDAARAIALGATAVGIGRPMLQAAMVGDGALDRWIGAFEHELRTAVFLTGGRQARDLRSARRVVMGPTAVWLQHMTD